MKITYGVLLLLMTMAVAGVVPAQASHQSHEWKYVGGSSTGFGIGPMVCAGELEGKRHGIGGACFTPCPHDTCDITVVDDLEGDGVWFQIKVDDEPFHRPQLYRHQVSVEGERVSVAVDTFSGTTGTITIA